jgi:hypothetical protein
VSRRLPFLLWLFVLVAALGAQSQQRPSHGSQPARDIPAQAKDVPPPPAGRILGRVLTADNGRPVKRARVFLTGAELPGGRGALTDDKGVFELVELPAGRYTVTVSKTGFVSLSYGQRRPLQAGTPLQLADGQQLKGVDFRLPRGSVIAGHVSDEDGDPMPGANVRVMRYQYLQGDRRLTPAGNAQTDDKGQYRVWGLMPGDYYVSAVARNANLGGRGGPFGRGGGGRGMAQADDEESLAYAPTYFPGVPSVNEAKSVTVGLGQEALDIDFNLHLVRTTRISGRVTNPDGTPTTSGNLNLIADVAAGRGGQLGVNYGSRIDWDGSFSIGNVPPGRYVLRARGDDTVTPQFASVPISVGSGDLDDVTVVLMPGGNISGTVSFPATQGPAPDLTQVRVAAPSLDAGLGQGTARVDKEGRFTIEGLAAGPHVIRPQGQVRGWSLKSVMVGGRDVTDVPIEVRSGQNIANVAITFTDAQTEIGGMVTNEQGAPVTEYTVLAFSTNATYWRPLSRHIMTARPDQTGQFKIRGLPAGEYYVVTVDPSEQGEWFEPAYLDEHRLSASRVTVGDGETKTQNFKLKIQN